MTFVIDFISWILMATGSIMLIIGAIGIVRLPDVFSRMHAAGVIDTMGSGAVLIGLMLQAGLTIVTVKLGLVIIFIMFTSPTATHALARASLLGGVDPQLEGEASKIFDHDQGSNPSKT
jgi:multicomponent Na+:H+ antiporter subunit G